MIWLDLSLNGLDGFFLCGSASKAQKAGWPFSVLICTSHKNNRLDGPSVWNCMKTNALDGPLCFVCGSVSKTQRAGWSVCVWICITQTMSWTALLCGSVSQKQWAGWPLCGSVYKRMAFLCADLYITCIDIHNIWFYIQNGLDDPFVRIHVSCWCAWVDLCVHVYIYIYVTRRKVLNGFLLDLYHTEWLGLHFWLYQPCLLMFLCCELCIFFRHDAQREIYRYTHHGPTCPTPCTTWIQSNGSTGVSQQLFSMDFCILLN